MGKKGFQLEDFLVSKAMNQHKSCHLSTIAAGLNHDWGMPNVTRIGVSTKVSSVSSSGLLSSLSLLTTAVRISRLHQIFPRGPTALLEIEVGILGHATVAATVAATRYRYCSIEVL